MIFLKKLQNSNKLIADEFFFYKLKVSLYKLTDGNWALINKSVTNADGRCADLLLQSSYQCGRYKLYFDVEKYFERLQTSSIYPFIEVSNRFIRNVFVYILNLYIFIFPTDCL